jgi:hypothetical protein
VRTSYARLQIGSRTQALARAPSLNLRADLRERLRRPGFLVVVALTAIAGYAFVPPAGASYTIYCAHPEAKQLTDIEIC